MCLGLSSECLMTKMDESPKWAILVPDKNCLFWKTSRKSAPTWKPAKAVRMKIPDLGSICRIRVFRELSGGPCHGLTECVTILPTGSLCRFLDFPTGQSTPCNTKERDAVTYCTRRRGDAITRRITPPAHRISLRREGEFLASLYHHHSFLRASLAVLSLRRRRTGKCNKYSIFVKW